MADYDLVIRGGTVADGTGSGTREADVAVKGGRIAAVGKVAGRGTRPGIRGCSRRAGTASPRR
jgi:N-acyl-D-aspartate/D-glutamate deacylase